TNANQNLHVEIAERRRIELELERQAEFEKLIATISTHFIGLTPGNIDDGIKLALFTIGEFVSVDRAYVYMLSPDRTMLTMTHEWSEPTLIARPTDLQNVQSQSLPTWMEMLGGFENVRVSSDSREYPPETGEARFLRSRKALSFLAVPMVYGGDLL